MSICQPAGLPGVNAPSPDQFAIADFCRDYLAATGGIHLVAIRHDAEPADIHGKFFGLDWQAAATWAAHQNSAEPVDVYFTFGMATVERKPKKADILGHRGFGIDIDPPKDPSAWDKPAVLADLMERGKPSYVISTGRGFQAAFLTMETGLAHELVETINRGLSAAFAGDATHNVDRLYKLPGTVAWGNAKKRAAGYIPTLATLIVPYTGAVHTSADLLLRFPGPAAPVAIVEALPDGPDPRWTIPHKSDEEIVSLMLAESPKSIKAAFGMAPMISDIWHGTELAQDFYDRDASSLDLGALSKLAFYAGRDPVRMERIFTNLSPLGQREKWRNRPDYRAITIAKAIASCTNVYSVEQTFVADPIAVDGEIVAPNDPLPISELSHVELADAAVHFLARRWRYVPAWKAWYRFEGNGWREDATIHHEIAQVCQGAARKKEMATEATKRSMASFSTISGVTKLAQANPAMIAAPDDFDADAWSLSTPGGIVDLRTGELRSSRPDDLTTMTTAVAPAEVEDCPRWHQFITEATGSDCDLAIYLQKIAGYALTGIASEQQLWVFTGQGGNGKGTLTQTLQRLLGSYAKEATPETFVNTRNSQHLAFIASLHRKRFVSVAEMPRGVSWNLQRIQSFTGGDAVEANHMASNPFTFVPVFTLVISANEPPILSAADNAVRRRFRFVPFDHTPTHRDRDLGEKLKAEWPGILRWAINGCLAWQRDGLNPPPAVTIATDEQIDGDDYIGQWLHDESEVAPGKWASNRSIHESYACWARDNGGPEMSMNSLGRRLRGYDLLKGFGGRDGKQREIGRAHV